MKKDEMIRNNQTGETLTMFCTGEESRGTGELYHVTLPPWRQSPPLHYHVAFTETFLVLEGMFDIYLGQERRRIVLKPQESVTAQIGQLHTFANERDKPTLMTVETRPAGNVAKAFQLAYGIANDGGAAKDGLPSKPLIRLLFIRISQGFLPHIPLWLQKAIFGIAAFISTLTGVNRRLTKYF